MEGSIKSESESEDCEKNHNPKIIFRVRAPSAHPESFQAIFLVGSIAALGNWDEERALPLATSEETFPFWTTEPIDIQQSQKAPITSFDFKYFRQKWLDREGDAEGRGLSYWEPLPPRTFRMPEKSLIITSSFGVVGPTKTEEANDDDIREATEIVERSRENGTAPLPPLPTAYGAVVVRNRRGTHGCHDNTHNDDSTTSRRVSGIVIPPVSTVNGDATAKRSSWHDVEVQTDESRSSFGASVFSWLKNVAVTAIGAVLTDDSDIEEGELVAASPSTSSHGLPLSPKQKAEKDPSEEVQTRKDSAETFEAVSLVAAGTDAMSSLLKNVKDWDLFKFAKGDGESDGESCANSDVDSPIISAERFRMTSVADAVDSAAAADAVDAAATDAVDAAAAADAVDAAAAADAVDAAAATDAVDAAADDASSGATVPAL